MPGRRWTVASLVCAILALALAIAPVVFGPPGVVAGGVAVWKDARWWGTAGVTGSAGAAIIGVYLPAWLAT